MRRDPASYTDPNGFVYWEDDRVRRRIHAAAVPFMREVLATPALRALVAAGGLVEATIAHADAEGLVLAHPRVGPASYPQEWCMPMLRDAARCVLDVALAAAEGGLMLADGHPWNVFFDGPRPVFLDWGSFAPPSTTLLWPARAQFDRFARLPLHLYAAGLPELARARLADLALGVTPELARRALPWRYLVGHPGLGLGLAAHGVAERATAGHAASSAVPKASDPATLARLRPGYLRGLVRELDGLAAAPPAGAWADYYATCPGMAADEERAKEALVGELLAREMPASVVDLGTNTGRYALLAARAGARVTAVDQDEASVARLYHEVRAAGLPVLPLVMDLGNPTPATGWLAQQRPDAPTRLAADMALALALVHHLVFTGNHDMAQVARLLACFARRVAVLEWVAPEDVMAVHLRRTATKDFGFYTLEGMVAALEAEGFAVEALAPHAPTRRLLVARRAA